MTTFHVDSDQVLTTASAAQATIERLMADTAGLNAQLTGLQGAWSGQASAAFQSAVAEWRAVQQSVEQTLAGVQQALGAAGSRYAEVEQANAALFVR